MISIRLRTKISQEELNQKIGKIVTEGDYNALLTQDAKLYAPNGDLLAVYLKGALSPDLRKASYPTLHSLKNIKTQNRGMASGTPRTSRGTGATRTETMPVASALVGAIDPSGQQKYCRLTAWTGKNTEQFEELHPMWQRIAELFKQYVPDRYEKQMEYVNKSHPEWIIPGTPFSTSTVNNCVDPETQCLTKRLGWTNYDQLRKDDEILAFDPGTQTTRWEPVLDIYINNSYQGEMVDMSARGFSALTTPDHRWPVVPPTFRESSQVTVKYSKDLANNNTYWNLLRNAPHEAPLSPTYKDEFVRLAAWYFCEGTLLQAGTSVSLCQSILVNPDKVEMIRADLAALGARPYTEWKERPCIEDDCDERAVCRDRCNRHACAWRSQQIKTVGPDYEKIVRTGRSRRKGLWVNEYLEPNSKMTWVLTGDEVMDLLTVIPGKDKVPTPGFLAGLTQDQLEMFINVCLEADGYLEQRKFYQYNHDRMAAFVMATTLAGYAPTLNKAGNTCSLRVARSTHKAPRITAKSVKFETQHYSGTIWCPRVPSSHWVARRAGSVYVTGNTYPTGVHTDKGDLGEGFSTLACIRKGNYTGGTFVFVEYRIGVDMQDGDLLLMDAHQWHGNTLIDAKTEDAERISIVSYYRTKVAGCGTGQEEAQRAQKYSDKRSGFTMDEEAIKESLTDPA